MEKLRLVFACLLVGVSLAGCSAKEKNAQLSEPQSSAKIRLESQMKTAAQTAQTYRAMDNPALLKKLVEQSASHKEPFNSLAYRELRVRKDVDTASLVALVQANANASGQLPLLLLRRLDNTAYLAVPVELRAQILTDALRGSKNFNTWGLPHLYLEDASHALIEAGKSATPALMRMLSETRPAPVFGSQEYMEYKRYNYRLCDYALFFLEVIQGHADFRIPASAADRDTLIKQMSST